MFKIFIVVVASGFFLGCLKCTGSQETSITTCDRSIASVMCEEFLEQTSECALLMPKDEQPFFFDCAEKLEISTSKEWPEMLGDLCGTEDIAQSVVDLISCWDEKMNATVDELKDDKVYPFEHFNCKEKLYHDAVKKTDCLCQLEKGMACQMLEVPKIG